MCFPKQKAQQKKTGPRSEKRPHLDKKWAGKSEQNLCQEFRGESGKWAFVEDLGRGSFKEEVNCQMQLKSQGGREPRKTPDLAKKIIIIWRQQNREEQRGTEVKR